MAVQEPFIVCGKDFRCENQQEYPDPTLKLRHQHTLKAGSHCSANLRRCNVADIFGQCEHCSSVIAVAHIMFGVLSEKFGSVKLFR